ncbi:MULTISPECIES: plasmid mobilization relaxosome protein MobC [Pseudooceanicola]|nr:MULTISPECIES: plasmid mobilization relaxosome protein MobC [Pseudooceanicola]
MVAGERRGVRAAYRQLRGLAVNANQIAHALNRGVLTGAGAELTKAEVERLRADISDLRKALSTYAEGRFKVQAGLGDDDQP